jgi:hypothetical protein
MTVLHLQTSNPFIPVAKAKNKQLTTPINGVYEKIDDRVEAFLSLDENNEVIQEALNELKIRLGGQIYRPKHFGELIYVPVELLDINIDIQRDLVKARIVANLINFDPRCAQPVNCTYITETGRYSAWEGQQTSATLYILLKEGLISKDFLVPCKVFADDLIVPGSPLTGEGAGNDLFRSLNTGREPIDLFWIHRSRVSAVRNYGSTLELDKQSNQIQLVLEKHAMFPAKEDDGKNNPLPGMVTYISGLNKIAGHGTEPAKFKQTLKDLDKTMAFHNKYFHNIPLVNGGFILAFGRLYAAARDAGTPISDEAEAGLADMIKKRYGTPGDFHNDCKTRLGKYQLSNGRTKSWKDSCLTPILVWDYMKYGNGHPLPTVKDMADYANV